MEELLKHIFCCVQTSKETLSLRQLNSDYRLLMGESIPFQKFGYRKLEELIQGSPDLILTRNGNDFYVIAKHSNKSAHMSEMIARQKSAKRKVSRVRFSRGPPPPRMQLTSRWRPTANFQTSRYQGSNRPRAVSHSQFVNKSPTVNYSAPSVSSKVVIPEQSSLNTKRAQQSVSAAALNLNQRLTSNRIQENIKLLSINNNNTIPNGNGFQASHNGSAPPSHINTGNDAAKTSQNKSKPAQNVMGKNSTDPLVSAKKRINKKMSELSFESVSAAALNTNQRLTSNRIQENIKSLSNNSDNTVQNSNVFKASHNGSAPLRDSGNSSPTNEISPPSPSKSPEFIRTKDPLDDLKSFAKIHKLGEVTVDITQFGVKTNKTFSCKIKVGKDTISSYPDECRNPLEAQACCCEKALSELIPKCSRKSLMISSEKDILARIPSMLEKHNQGIWAWQLKHDYSDKYNELLSGDWLKIIDSSPCVQIEKISEDHILYPCQPGDKGQQRGGAGVVPPSNVSVPANTVQFGADGKLVGQVTCVVSASEIWCEQIGTDESTSFAAMFDRLQIYYQEHEKQLVPESIVPAGYYIAKYEGVYYRARAVKINTEEVDCFFIDCGDEVSVLKSDIFVLKRVYAASQAQAFVCRLSGLEDLYDVSANSQSLASLCDKPVVLELAIDITSNENMYNDVLPVFMYDVETGHSINEEFIPMLTMELATPYLQPKGITDVYVSNIESNGDIYVQIRTQGYDNLQVLRKQIEEQITEKPPKEILHRVTKSNSREKLFFMKSKVTGSWHRTKLIDWSPDGEYAQIYFVDEGHTDVIRVVEETLYPLESLNDVLNNYPYQAVRVRMVLDVIPPNFVTLATQAMPKDQPVLLKIVHSSGSNIPAVKLFKRNADGGLFCINESVALETELRAKKDDSLKGKFKLSQFGGSDLVPSTGSLKCPPLPKVGEAIYFEVHVIVAVSPYNFFVQPLDSMPQLNKMMETLQKRYTDVQYGNLKVDDVLPGSIYASRHDDGFWYRTSVIKVINSGSSVSVFYCDFGYYQTLSVKQLLPLDQEFMQLPYQALKAKLAGIKPKQSKWTMEDCEQFKELIEKKLLFANLTNIEKDILYESDLVLKLLLIDTNTDEDVVIGQELVKRGIAVEGE